jgi:nucleotide-binding universal stress UspA family protein
MFQKILVAYDDGKHAAQALDAAIELAKNKSAEIIIVSAYTVPTNDWERYANMSGGHPDDDTKAAFHEHNRKFLEMIQVEAAEKVRQANISVQTVINQGKPGPAVTKIAKDFNADLIIIGSHNRGSVGQFFLGSVSNYVLHNAGCPVLIIKN